MVIASSRRVGALLLFSVFTVLFGESAVVLSCPMHANVETSSRVAVAGHQHQTPSTPEPCDCIGDCPGNPSVVAAAPAPGLGPVDFVLGDAQTVDSGVDLPSHEQLRLPDAQGPPATTSA